MGMGVEKSYLIMLRSGLVVTVAVCEVVMC